MRSVLRALAILLPLFSGGVAMAQELTPIWWVDELRGGLFFHSTDYPTDPSPLFGFIDKTRGVDINAEVLFSPFDLGELSYLGKFRPHVGATVSTNGLESMLYAGLSWTFHPFDGPVFVEASLGGSVNNGKIVGTVYPERSLGCNVLFRESVSIGFDITDNASIMATAEHASHAGLCGPNNSGLTNMGVRFGFRF